MSRNRTIDVLRGMSVLAVILGHCVVSRFVWVVSDGTFSEVSNGITGLWRAGKAILWRTGEGIATLGVGVFFVISGYLITKLLDEELRKSGRISISAFYIRRVFRIFPALFLFIGVVIALSRAGVLDLNDLAFAHAASFTCNMTTECGWGFGHLWSLAVEEQFYLVWPVLFVAVGYHRITTIRLIAGLTMIVAATGRLDAYSPVGFGFASIALGALYAIDRSFRVFVDTRLTFPMVVVAVILFLSIIFIPHSAAVDVAGRIVRPVAVFLVVAHAVQSDWGKSPTGLFSALEQVGLMSYGLYLWQQIFMFSVTAVPAGSLLQQPWWLVLIVPASFFLLERPLIAVGRRLSARFAQERRGGSIRTAVPQQFQAENVLDGQLSLGSGSGRSPTLS